MKSSFQQKEKKKKMKFTVFICLEDKAKFKKPLTHPHTHIQVSLDRNSGNNIPSINF
jgi:hypothetical protein